MRKISRAVTRTAAAGADEFPGAYLAALAAGKEDVGLSRTEELQLGPLGLLVLALVRMPDLFVYCHLLEASDLDPPCERLPPVAVVRVWILAGAALGWHTGRSSHTRRPRAKDHASSRRRSG